MQINSLIIGEKMFKKSGFSLIELMIVIAIVAFLGNDCRAQLYPLSG